MPGVSRDTTTAANSTSLVEYGPSSASMMAWVPHSTKPTSRAWGNADRSPFAVPGRPKNASFSSLSATSKVVPSIDTSRRPANHAPGVDNDANGTATRRNNTRSGSAPNLTRAWNNPELDGNTYFSRQRDTHDKPFTSCAKTSS